MAHIETLNILEGYHQNSKILTFISITFKFPRIVESARTSQHVHESHDIRRRRSTYRYNKSIMISMYLYNVLDTNKFIIAALGHYLSGKCNDLARRRD